MALTDLQKRKLDRMFSILDVDGDGRIGRSDYTARVRALARLRGWAEGTPEYDRNLAFALEEWDNVVQSADADEDDGVSRAEFHRYADVFLGDRDAVRAYARGDTQLLFDAMDTDRDGKLSAEEYREYLQVCGADGSVAHAFFAHADLDGDGRLTRAEMAHAMEEFLLSTDPASGANTLFGPL